MSNPVMNQLEADFEKRTPAGYPAMPEYQVGEGRGNAQTGRYQNGAYPQDQAMGQPQTPGVDDDQGRTSWSGTGHGSFDRLPSQSPPSVTSRPMTMDDVLIKTGLCFLVLLAAATGGWIISAGNQGLGMMLAMGGALVGMLTVIFSSFRRQVGPATALVYAVAEGVFLGAFSLVMQQIYPGIVIEAVLGTLAVFLTSLVLFRTGLVRVNSKVMKFMLIGLVGIVIYRLAAMLLTATGVLGTAADLYTIAGIPLGVIVGVVAVLIGALMLISDFDTAREGVRLGAPKELAWSCALGLMVTVVWIYIEILRLLQYLRIFSSD